MEAGQIRQRNELKEEDMAGVKASSQRVRSPGWGLLGAGGAFYRGVGVGGDMTGARQEGAFPCIWTDAVPSSLVSRPYPCSQPSSLPLFHATVKMIFL